MYFNCIKELEIIQRQNGKKDSNIYVNYPSHIVVVVVSLCFRSLFVEAFNFTTGLLFYPPLIFLFLLVSLYYL